MKQEIKDFLNKYGKQIGKDARDGNICAQRIIDFYTLYHERAEHISLTLLELEVREYQEKYWKGDSNA